jgi:hypothetical protein
MRARSIVDWKHCSEEACWLHLYANFNHRENRSSVKYVHSRFVTSKLCIFLSVEVTTCTACFNSQQLYTLSAECVHVTGPPLWSSGHSSGLQIQRSGFDSLHYQIFWELVGLKRGPLSLLSTIEELLGRKSSGSGLESRDYGRRGSAALTTRHPSIRKSWH